MEMFSRMGAAESWREFVRALFGTVDEVASMLKLDGETGVASRQVGAGRPLLYTG